MKGNQLKKKWGSILGLILMSVIIALNASAQEASEKPAVEAMERHNKPGLFVGNTHDGSKNGLSIGLEYEYLLSQLFGLGAMVEYAGGDHNAWVLGVPFFLHPYAGWFLLLMPGVEIEDHENSFLVRAGVGYDFEIAPKWSLAPEFNVDFIEGGDRKLIYGLTVAREF